jgi:ABC-type transport system involved in Fe-S cluster assembly fused permease/ATPase subunit
MPLNNLGTIYNMTVQGFIDFRQFMELLLSVPEIVDEENALDIPITITDSAKQNQLVNGFGSMNSSKRTAGVSVEFKGEL